MRTPPWKKLSDIMLILLVIPIVLLLIVSFLQLTENEILNLSKNKMELRSKMYADAVITWSEQIVSQLNVYKRILDEEGEFNDHSIEILSASYGEFDGYPFGLYWGDENKNFYDISGWDPGPEFDPTKRSWFAEGLQHTDSFAFGEPYLDMKTGKTAVCVSVKVDCADVACVLGADVYFDYLTSLVEDISRTEISHAFLVTEKSRLILADSDWNMTGKNLDEAAQSEFYRNIRDLLDNGFVGMTLVKGEGDHYVNIYPIDNLDWYFVTCMEKADMHKNFWTVSLYIFVIGVLACVVLIFLIRRTSRRMSVVAQMAKTDSLTRLLNREGFDSAIKKALKHNPDQGMVLMLDVDNFKRINDELGHPVGDRFLKELAAMMSGYFNRKTDVCARLGGDEFVVLVERKINAEEAAVMLDKFLERFHRTFDEKYAAQQISVSIGAAFIRASGSSTLEAIYQCTDKALYQAKSEGKDRYVIDQQ